MPFGPQYPWPLSALGNYGSQFLNQFQGMSSPVVSTPPLDSGMDLTGLPDLSGLGNLSTQDAWQAFQRFASSPIAPHMVPFPPGGALPLARDIYRYFSGEDANAKANAEPPPPTLEAILREANANRAQHNDMPNVQSFDLGSLPPGNLFQTSPVGMVGNVDYSQFANALPQAQRMQREVQPPTDFGAADAAMQAAKPTYEEGNPWGQVLQGLARGALSSRDGDFSQILFSAALGALGGLGSGMDIEQERKDLAKGREQQFNERLAGYDLEKAGTQRSEKQQASDAAYEADVNFNQQEANRQQQIVSILMHGADQNAENMRHNASVSASTANMNRQLALQRFQLSQPNVDVNQYGVVTTTTGPDGKRTMTIDNSPWVQRLQMQAMYRQMGKAGAIPGADMPGMGYTNETGPMTVEDIARKAATAYFMNPVWANSDLPEGSVTAAAMQTRQMYGDNPDKALYAQGMANNLYGTIMEILQDPNHPLNAALRSRLPAILGMF